MFLRINPDAFREALLQAKGLVVIGGLDLHPHPLAPRFIPVYLRGIRADP
jgi:hypothetical protein